jgi:hypothetical protein
VRDHYRFLYFETSSHPRFSISGRALLRGFNNDICCIDDGSKSVYTLTMIPHRSHLPSSLCEDGVQPPDTVGTCTLLAALWSPQESATAIPGSSRHSIAPRGRSRCSTGERKDGSFGQDFQSPSLDNRHQFYITLH